MLPTIGIGSSQLMSDDLLLRDSIISKKGTFRTASYLYICFCILLSLCWLSSLEIDSTIIYRYASNSKTIHCTDF